MKKVWVVAIALISFCSVVSAQKSPVYAPKGIALDGYDAVAFFTQGKPVKGSSVYALQWNSAQWLFADQTNLESFKKTPEKYAPQYGGYCAYGAAQGHKAPVEIDTWSIVGNKLYLNYNQKVKSTWLKDEGAYIETANKNWLQIRDKE
ncbi:MAG TPA: YHS domain-containing (seleno)protein [Puia sp.]